MKVVSYSLWGNNPKYTIGALRNAELVKKYYPGWEARFYIGSSTDKKIVDELKNLGANVIEMTEKGDWRGMFWRFDAASDNDVDVMISRDCDSRISLREVAAVNRWIESGAMFHIMRDHPWHGAPILGGMWGVKSPFLKNMRELITCFEKGDFWQVDQNFLKTLFPLVKPYAMVHDDFFEKKPWPTARIGLEFVGQVFDENETTIQEHLDVLEKYLRQ
jgi:hypothetical protein